MRPFAITQNITVDGSIEMLGDWFEPQGSDEVDTSDLISEVHRQDQRADALVVGRRTFEDMRDYWPHQADDRTGVADYLNRVRKYVVSSTLIDPRWDNSTVVPGDPVDEIAALKHEDGADIMLTGSISLAHTLIEAGLVDEYRLFTYPVVQGSGRRLFPDGYAIPHLRLSESKSFACGITFHRYLVA